MQSKNLDAFADFRTGCAQRPKPPPQLAEATENDVLRFLKEPNTRREVRNLAFASFRRHESRASSRSKKLGCAP